MSYVLRKQAKTWWWIFIENRFDISILKFHSFSVLHSGSCWLIYLLQKCGFYWNRRGILKHLHFWFLPKPSLWLYCSHSACHMQKYPDFERHMIWYSSSLWFRQLALCLFAASTGRLRPKSWSGHLLLQSQSWRFWDQDSSCLWLWCNWWPLQHVPAHWERNTWSCNMSRCLPSYFQIPHRFAPNGQADMRWSPCRAKCIFNQIFLPILGSSHFLLANRPSIRHLELQKRLWIWCMIGGCQRFSILRDVDSRML